jgi:hypothetical protein
MAFSPEVDMGAGVVVYMYGVVGLAFWGVPAFIIEGFILRLWLPAARAFLASLLMNLVSTIAGYVAAGLFLPSLQTLANTLLDLETSDTFFLHYDEVGPHTMLTFVFIIVVFWLISFLIEGGILLILEKSLSGKDAWIASLVANIASYILPTVIILVWLSYMVN